MEMQCSWINRTCFCIQKQEMQGSRMKKMRCLEIRFLIFKLEQHIFRSHVMCCKMRDTSAMFKQVCLVHGYLEKQLKYSNVDCKNVFCVNGPNCVLQSRWTWSGTNADCRLLSKIKMLERAGQYKMEALLKQILFACNLHSEVCIIIFSKAFTYLSEEGMFPAMN